VLFIVTLVRSEETLYTNPELVGEAPYILSPTLKFPKPEVILRVLVVAVLESNHPDETMVPVDARGIYVPSTRAVFVSSRLAAI
jgi:hypothetical protein